MPARRLATPGGAAPTVALVDWSPLIEDFLDGLGLSFAEFRDEMSGGWMFGYVDALARAGVRTVVVCVSARVADVERHVHAATGAPLVVLPAPRAYRALRRSEGNPYAPTPPEAWHAMRPSRRLLHRALRQAAPYLSTPPRALARVLREERCDVLLGQDYEHARFDVCLAVGRALGLPVFATFQGGDAALAWIERVPRPLALRAADGLIIGTSREAERVRRRYGVAAAGIARIFNPLDTSVWWEGERGAERAAARSALGIPDDARVVAWHGRIAIHDKGLDVLLDAWARLRAARPGADLRLLLLGAGPDGPALARRLAAPELGGVHWRDEYVRDRGEIRRRLAAADVYAFTSRREGFPVAPVEAMACALPVVAADAPGVADILDDGERSGGIIVPTADGAATAAAIGRLLDDPALARTLGARARARAEEAFSPERVGAQLRDFLFRERKAGAHRR